LGQACRLLIIDKPGLTASRRHRPISSGAPESDLGNEGFDTVARRRLSTGN
jgi:hypothetical protein